MLKNMVEIGTRLGKKCEHFNKYNKTNLEKCMSLLERTLNVNYTGFLIKNVPSSPGRAGQTGGWLIFEKAVLWGA